MATIQFDLPCRHHHKPTNKAIKFVYNLYASFALLHDLREKAKYLFDNPFSALSTPFDTLSEKNYGRRHKHKWVFVSSWYDKNK